VTEWRDPSECTRFKLSPRLCHPTPPGVEGPGDASPYYFSSSGRLLLRSALAGTIAPAVNTSYLLCVSYSSRLFLVFKVRCHVPHSSRGGHKNRGVLVTGDPGAVT